MATFNHDRQAKVPAAQQWKRAYTESRR
jgi:hypothetical protein